MIVTDCSQGAHAGMAFLDNVRVGPCACTAPTPATICDNPCALRAPITHSVYPNAMDGTTNPFLIYIYNATDVDFYVFNRWDGGTAYEYHTHNVNGLKDSGQDYFTLKYFGAKAGGGAIIASDQYDIKIHMKNCGDDQWLGPSPLTVLSASSQLYPSVSNDTFAAPTMTAQPPFLSLTQGSTATFTVTATGAAPLTYQWRKDGYPLFDGPSLGGGTISGAYTATLTITPANQADAGVYDVVVTNACCVSVTSAAGGLCFPALTITSQPQDLVVPLGGTATFAVAASDPNSATPLTYAWCRADQAFCYNMQFTPTFTIANVGSSDYGTYFAQVSSQCGTALSRVATLRGTGRGPGGGGSSWPRRTEAAPWIRLGNTLTSWASDGVNVEFGTNNVAGRMTVCVYDLQGKRVATLFDGELPAMTTRGVSWTGSNADRGPSRPGVYWVRARLNDVSIAQKIVFIR